MYNYHNGQINSPGLELVLVLVRVIAFAALIFIALGTGMAAGLPPVVSGTVAGLFAAGLMLKGSFLEVISFRCPHCGATTKSIRNFGSYRCSNCGETSIVTRDEIAKL